MMRRQHVVPNFFDGADAMREILDRSFGNTYTDRIDWQYFCDPGLYAYLRTAPQRTFPKPLFEGFMQRLRQWCMDNLGLTPMNLPYLHLMVNGCRLGLHSDFHNGAWGYVYSLTRWDSRNFAGGETLLLRDGIPSYKKHHVHGDVLYELIPARFNQLLVFDDRIVHATPTIEGSMSPIDGRIALVGHIRATSPTVSGSREPSEVRRVVLKALPQLRERIRRYNDVQGTITYRLEIAASGVVDSVRMLTDNVVTPLSGYGASDAAASVKALVHETVHGLRFPSAADRSIAIVPILIPLPDLRPIEIEVPFESSRDAVYERAEGYLREHDRSELNGHWQADEFIVKEPIAGTISIEPHHIAMFFDPPMWVPSQRERFQASLIDLAKALSASQVTPSAA